MGADPSTGDVVAPRRGRPPRTEAERAARRREVVDAALDAVRRLGAEASVDEIAATVGVSKPVLYDLVGDKVGLADAMAAVVAEQVTASVLEAASGSAAGPVGLADVIRAVVGELVRLIETDDAVYAFLVRTLRSGDRGFFDSALVRVVRDRGALIAPTMAPGVPDALLPVLIDGVFGFVFFAVESWNARRSPDRAVLIESLTELVVRAVG